MSNNEAVKRTNKTILSYKCDYCDTRFKTKETKELEHKKGDEFEVFNSRGVGEFKHSICDVMGHGYYGSYERKYDIRKVKKNCYSYSVTCPACGEEKLLRTDDRDSDKFSKLIREGRWKNYE